MSSGMRQRLCLAGCQGLIGGPWGGASEADTDTAARKQQRIRN